MKVRILTTLMAVLLLFSCKETTTSDKVKGKGDALDRMEALYRGSHFREALAVCDSMLTDDAYRIDSLSEDGNNRRYITIMRRRILTLEYLSRQEEAVRDMKTLSDFCNSKEDDKENSYSSVAAQMDVKIGLAEIDMGKVDEGFATIDKGIDAMRDKTSKNARMATVNFMHDKARALDEQNRKDESTALSLEALERIKQLREAQDSDVQDFCEFYEGNFYALLAYVYIQKAERGKAEAADSVRYYYDKAMKVPHWSEMTDCDIMLLPVYCFLDMQPEYERAYRQVEENFAHDTLTTYYIDVQRQAAQMAQKHGDNARALALMERAARLQSLQTKNKSMKSVAEAANAYEMAEMERKQKDMEVSRLKWIIMAVCLGFAALTVSIVLFYFHRRNRRMHQRYTTIINAHDTNEMVIRALKMDPATSMDDLLTLTGDSKPDELEHRFELINDIPLDEFRARLQQDEAEEEASIHENIETVTPEQEAFLKKLDNVLLTDDRLFRDEILRKDISRDMEMPMMHITKHLKDFTGCTLTAYITQKRLEHAAHLLLTTEDKVEVICHASGFSSIATFYRQFTKQYGCPPAEYRMPDNGE